MFAVDTQINNMNYQYDRDHDVLHLYFGVPTVSYGDEPYPGVFIKYSDADDTITGAVILDFKKKDSDEINRFLPINISFFEIKKDLSLVN